MSTASVFRSTKWWQGGGAGQTPLCHTLIPPFVRAGKKAEADRCSCMPWPVLKGSQKRAQGAPFAASRGLQESRPSPGPYEASSIQSSFSRMASMWGLLMTTSSSSSSDGSDWVSMAPMRSTMGLEGRGQGSRVVMDDSCPPLLEATVSPKRMMVVSTLKQGPLVLGPNLTPMGLLSQAGHVARQ